MSCDITQGRVKGCKDAIAGTTKVFLFNYLENPFTVVDGVATAINPLLTDVFQYDLIGDANTFVESMVGDRNTGTSPNTQTLTLALHKITKEDHNQFNLLVYGYPQAVVKDRMGNYMIVGITDGIDFTVSPTTGGAKADFNGYNLTGLATEATLAPMLDASTISAFLDLVSEDTPSV
jgi:hypothetical protein